MGWVADAMIKLDGFPEVVDYSSCRDEMLQRVTKPGGLLQQELNNSTDFKSMWKANATCKVKIPGARQEHMAALKSYADASHRFHELFNMKLYSKGKNITTYQNEFPFKSLYFLLTDVMQHLSKDMCQTVYSAVEKEFSGTFGDLVRFGTFLPAKLEYMDALEEIIDVGGTIFNITSCSLVNLDVKCQSEEIDMLISPTDSFDVKKMRVFSSGDETIREVNLVQHAFKSSFDCKSLFR